jgi:hypothetical protein
MKKTLREIWDEESKRLFEHAAKESLLKRFQVGTQNDTKLNRALVLGKVPHLINRTLLTPSIHNDHSERLLTRLLRMCEGRTNATVHFTTILDSLELLDHTSCLTTIKKFRQRLENTTTGIQGLHLIGTIECEVVLEVLESMCRRQINARHRDLPCFFLIHFHGIAVFSDNALDEWSRVCRTLWKHDPRQVEIKKLSEEWQGERRSLSTNLTHIARYITKGGNDWRSGKSGETGKSYLRYKIGFENTDTPTEEEWIRLNWKRSQVLKQERREEGLDDAFSLTVNEICQLARVIDGMMGTHPHRTGYVVEHKTPKTRIRRRTK